MNKLGQRIKYFRKRAGMSQLELENAISASPGMVSRIENGQVNPTKETMDKLAQALKINHRELSYIAGPLALPASKKEIGLAIAEVKDHLFDEKVLAYVLDDRYRVLAISQGFVNLFKTFIEPSALLGWALGHSILRLTLDEKLGVAKFLYTDNFEQAWEYQLSRFQLEMGFMQDDEFYLEGLESIRSNKIAKGIWEKIQNDFRPINNLDSKQVRMDFEGSTLDFGFSREPIAKYPRFETLEFFINPANGQ